MKIVEYLDGLSEKVQALQKLQEEQLQELEILNNPSSIKLSKENYSFMKYSDLSPLQTCLPARQGRRHQRYI